MPIVMPPPGPESTNLPERNRVVLTGISARAWEHPADRASLAAVRKVPGGARALRALAGLVREPSLHLLALGSDVRVSARQFRRLHTLHLDACRVLDVVKVPELYVTQDPHLSAWTIGIDRPFVTLTTGLVEALDEEELRFTLAHELGHVLSGHAVYGTMLRLLAALSTRSFFPLGTLGLRALVLALEGWQRAAELSGDRAGLLGGQDPDAAQRALQKLAGGGRLLETDANAFLEQGREYEAAGDLRGGVLKLLNLSGRGHPFTAVRAVRLRDWVDDGSYRRVLAGTYPLRGEDREVRVTDEWRAGWANARTRFAASEDPLITFLRDVGEDVGGAGGRVVDQVVRRFRGGDRTRGEDPDG